ncbi:MAG: efflux RND transporter permease subunit [Vicinamibacterales bacterium]
MLISDVAIRRPVLTVVAILALVGFGVYALVDLQTDEFPDIQAPIVAVAIPYPGAAPDTVERELIEPLEEALLGLSGIDDLRSTAQDSFAQVIAVFDFAVPVEQASQDVRDAISAIRGDLPAEMEEPIIRRFDPNELPIVSLVLASETLDADELTSLADPDLIRALRGVNGVAQVNLVGGVQRELTVGLRPASLEAANISAGQVVQRLQAQNLAAPVGRLTTASRERAIRLEGRVADPFDFRQIIIEERGGQIIRLGQLAEVAAGTEEPRSLALYNGERAVGLDVIKTTGSSTTAVAAEVLQRVESLRATLPTGVTLAVVRDAGERVEASVDNVQRALLEGASLTVLVVFLFLNSWRSTVITGLALPVSVIASFIAVWAFGFTLNTMSLLGLSLAIGILIDDAIVVRENIVRHVQMGKDHRTAAFEGTDEIGLAVAATTFSIIAVFVPIAVMGGIAGQWFKPFALTIACSVLVSLFVSFSLDPMLSAYWPDPDADARHGGLLRRTLHRFNAWFDRQADRYRDVIGWALDHRWSMIGLAGLSLVAAAALQVWFVGASFVPQSDRSELNVIIETPPGSSLDYTRVKAQEASRVIRHQAGVAYTYTTIGGGAEFGTSGSVDTATIYVRLTPKGERDADQQTIARALRDRLRQVSNIEPAIFSSGFGGAQREIQVQVRGPQGDRLLQLAEEVESLVRDVPGAEDVALSVGGRQPEIEVAVDRSLAGSLGVSVGDVAQALRIAFAGVDAGDWIDPSGETRDVVVRLAPEARARPADLERLPIVLPAGAAGGGTPQAVPLGQIAQIGSANGPARIEHLDGDPVVTVGANVVGLPLGVVSSAISDRLAAFNVPPGYQVTFGGQVEDQQEVFGDVFAALGLAVMLMYLVLVAQFNSFVDPLAILISLPLSFIGVALALVLTGETLNLMSLIGIILLMGVVAKNAILLLDFAKWSRDEGLGRREAIVEAGRIRLRPIIMTTMALVAGMTPVALGLGEGADFRAPLGRAVIGGVLTSTILTLLVIPTVYEILDDLRSWAGQRLGGSAFRRGPDDL